MTTALTASVAPLRRSLPRRLRDEEVAELARLTAGLPHLHAPAPRAPTDTLADGVIRTEAALWEVARRHHVDICPRCSVLDVADALAAKGWTTGSARDALRAVVMLSAATRVDSSDRRAAAAVDRLIGYLELRARMG